MNKKTIQFSESISWQEIKSKNLIYIYEHKFRKEYFLEDVGREIWLLINQGKNYEEIICNLKVKYSVDLQTLKDDLNDLLQDFEEKRLIRCYKK